MKEMTTILADNYNTYNTSYDTVNSIKILSDLNNKLFCTFTTLEDLDDLLNSITSKYDVLYNKIFVLYIKSNEEYVCTYNIDSPNVSSLPENTILVHRKKESNTKRNSQLDINQHQKSRAGV